MKLILTEKKDQAEKIAKVMGWKLSKGCFEGTFEGDSVKMVWARGHLVTLMNPNEVRPELSWDDPEALTPIPTTFPIKVNDDIPNAPSAAQPRRYVDNIKHHLKGVDEFIIATDADREGEAIGWLLLDYLGYKGKVRRAWFSAGLDTKSLKEAMANLRPSTVTKSWFRASEARSRSDWAYMFLVRAYTYYAQYQMFGSSLGTGSGRERVMSVGRVQTPALAMIVKRDREIDQFVAKDHFKITGDFSMGGSETPLSTDYRPVVTRDIIDSMPKGVEWELPRGASEDSDAALEKPLFTGKEEVNAFKARLESVANQGKVIRYEEKERRESPPKTFSLTEAQSTIAGACKISANLAQTVLEDLYEQGWTSYARTAKSDLPMNFYEPDERNGLLNSVMQLAGLAEPAKTAKLIHDGSHEKYQSFIPACFTDKPLEHHGIVPTHQVMTPTAFAGLRPEKKNEKGRIQHTQEHMQKAYEIVAKQFIQALLPPVIYTQQEIDISLPTKDILGNETSLFRTTGRILIDAGWKNYFDTSTDGYLGVPSLKEEDPATLVSVGLKASKTSPPKRYTERNFQKALENVGREVSDPKLRKLLKNSEGIGTPATRKNIIDTLLARGYIETKKGTYYSTQKGADLVDAVPEWMSSPEQTALWEDYLVKICDETDDEKGVKMRDQFVSKQIDRIESLIKDLNVNLMPEASKRVRTTASPSKVTTKMKAAIKKIADSKSITIPKGTLSDPRLAKAFLDEHIGNSDGKPSEKQLALLESIIKAMPDGFKPDEDVFNDRKACSEFIDKHISKMPSRPPSEAAKKFAEDLISKLPEGEKAPDNVLTDAKVCSAFIDSQVKNKKAKPKPSRKSKRPSTKK